MVLPQSMSGRGKIEHGAAGRGSAQASPENPKKKNCAEKSTQFSLLLREDEHFSGHNNRSTKSFAQEALVTRTGIEPMLPP